MVVVVLSVELQRRIRLSQTRYCILSENFSRCCAGGRGGEVKIAGEGLDIEPLWILDVPAVCDHPNLAALVAGAPQRQPGILFCYIYGSWH